MVWECGDCVCALLHLAKHTYTYISLSVSPNENPHQHTTPHHSLYTCNVTSTTRPHQPDDQQAAAAAAEAAATGAGTTAPQLLAYDHLRPDDYPFTYFVFINANVLPAAPDTPPTPQTLPESRAVNQTVRYAATFSPSYAPNPATLPQPAFALLLLLCAFCFVCMSAYVSAPVLDWLSTTRCGKRCLRSRA
jgi:hypothetical protein